MQREVSLQLMVAKRMYIQGAKHAGSNNKLYSGIAVSLFQDSIELALLAAINKNDIDPGKGMIGFKQYIDLLEGKGITIPLKQRIYQVNNTRVQFKHYGVCPDPSEAIRFDEATKAFLDQFLESCFGISIDQISLCSLIEDDELRSVLYQAEEKLNSRDLDNSLVHLSAAKSIIFTRHSILLKPILSGNSRIDQSIESAIRKAIKPLEAVALAGLLGINAYELRKILPLPSASKNQNGEWDATFRAPFWNSETLRDSDLATEILDILISVAIRSEESLKPVRYRHGWMNTFF